MKVKITKTIDMHQIPAEVRRMLHQLKNTLMHNMTDSMGQVVRHSLSSQGNEFFYTIDLIDSFRKDLATFDESLQEAQNILSGYKMAISPADTEQEEESVFDQEWLENEEAETEKIQARQMDADEEEYEEG